MRELRHADAGRSQVESPATCESSRISAFVKPASHQRRLHIVTLCGSLPRTIIAQVIHVHAINHVRNPARFRHFIQTLKQFVLAMKTPIRMIRQVKRIVKLFCFDIFVTDTVLARNSSAARLCDSGKEAESAVTAMAESPKTSFAAHAR